MHNDPLFLAYRAGRGLPPASAPRARAPRTRLRLRLRDEEGQALVEFALVLPLFMLLILGMIDFGVAFNDHNQLTQLAGEAARFAAVNNCGTNADGTPCTDIKGAVLADADSAGLKNGSRGATGTDQALKLCFSQPDGADSGGSVEATAETNYRWLPFLGLAKVKLRAHATMRIEQSPATAYTPTTLTASGDCPDYTG